jgi:ADP-ribosylation factor related protein 1
VCWDLGGRADLRSLWDSYFHDAHAIVFVVDAAAAHRFDEALSLLDVVARQCTQLRMPLLVMLNKQDVATSSVKARIDAVLQRACADGVDVRKYCRVQPCTALTGAGVQHGIAWLVQRLHEVY